MPPSLDQFIAECMANPTPAMQEISERMETAARREGANTVGALGMLSIPPVPPDDYLKLYAKALYIIRHALPEDPANEELQEIVESAFYSLNMQRVLLAGEPHTLTPSFITELWIPIIRSLPSQASTVPGAAMLATGWGFLPEEAMVSAMQVLSDILPMPWLTTMNRRGLWACLLHATVGVGPATLKDPRGRAKLVRRLQSCGLVKPIVRLTAQPLLESLPARVHADTDTIRNEYLMLLTLAVAIAVSSAEENPEAASLLAETESAVVANSPWVWTGLKRLGTTWAQARGPQTLVCAPYAFIMLASSGPRAYKAAMDAGGEALLRSLIDHLWETWPQKAPPPYFKEVLLGEFQGASGRSEEFNGWAVSFAVPLLCSQLVIAEVAGNEGCAEDIKEQMGLDLDEISAMIGANSYRGESLEADRWANQDVTVYVLADTTYNSLSVDEVAAAHIGADCVVHYGRASLTKLSRVPAFYVFPSEPMDVAAVADSLAGSSFFADDATPPLPPTVIFLDQPLLDALPDLESTLKNRLTAYAASLVFATVPKRSAEPQRRSGCCGGNAADCTSDTPCDNASSSLPTETQSAVDAVEEGAATVAGYVWSLPATDTTEAPPRFVWIGSADAPALQHLQLTHSAAEWLTVDPGGSISEGLPLETSRLLRRRRFLVEKARQANIVGILVGTLGAAGYGDALRTLRLAAQAAGKKTYTLLMGKPSPAKLANFPEIEVFVLVADPQGQILECRDYLAPVVTPHEAMLAFDPEGEFKWDEAAYRLDFDHVVAEGAGINAEKSENEKADAAVDDAAALVAQAQRALVVTPAAAGGGHLVEAKSAADYLVHKRSWKGVEAPLAGAEAKAPAAAVPGQSGRAAGYTHEPSKE